jgi:hypothetical protein
MKVNPRTGRRFGATVEYARRMFDENGIKPLRKRLCVRLTDCGYESPCWVVGPSCSSSSYATVHTVQGEALTAHRYVWAWKHGVEIPPGMVVHHECFTKRCVNPGHLALVTFGRNSQLSNFAERVVPFSPPMEEAA